MRTHLWGSVLQSPLLRPVAVPLCSAGATCSFATWQSASDIAAAQGDQAKRLTPAGSGCLCVTATGYGASRLPAPRKMLAVPAAGNTWGIFGSLKNANLNCSDLILHWLNKS